MGKTRRLLLKTYYEKAKRKRMCRRNAKHQILKGMKCLVVKELGWEKSYCMKCAKAILDKASNDIDKLKAGL
jgi:hypothetical protein